MLIGFICCIASFGFELSGVEVSMPERRAASSGLRFDIAEKTSVMSGMELAVIAAIHRRLAPFRSQSVLSS